MPSPRALVLVLLLAACAPGAALVASAEDGGEAGSDAGGSGGRDAGFDAGQDAGLDAGQDAGVDAGQDAGVAAGQDGGPDAGLTDGGWTGDYPINTTVPHWRPTFADEFRGKPGRADDAWCYDQLPAQCTIWPGGDTNNCDLSDVNDPGMIAPIKANLAAALFLFHPERDWNAASEPEVRAAYATLLEGRLKHLDKCVWSAYQMLNWMATDYHGQWSSRFDASRVTVDPSGKGTLLLSAAAAPVQAHCIYGGTLGAPNCQLVPLAAGELSASVQYWADNDPRWPGIYTAPVNGQCPVGGTFTGVNCLVKSLPAHFLDEGVPMGFYWVDPDPRWPGVYYADQAYRCRDNIDYSPSLSFRNLTCPILDGALLSMPAQNRTFDAAGVRHPRGFAQHFGRFEVKARVPKGVGAFPAAWLLPLEGGWPYAGGEIDILEARDQADEAYQTYHHGKCYTPATGQELAAALDPADCDRRGGQTVHLDLGYTARQRAVGELSKRDHVYAVEWTEGQLAYFVNDVRLGSIAVGTQAFLHPATAPAGLATYNASNFPSKPFYWILNHSTYVPPDQVAGFAEQTFAIDYVRVFDRCTRNFDFCPCGGAFTEGAGCRLGPGEPLHCPRGVVAQGFAAGVYAAACAPANQDCPNGGAKSGARCLVKELPGLSRAVAYWADADPRWPGVYYAKSSGGCPAGGTFTGVNCQLAAFPGDLLEAGVDYLVDAAATPAGVYYTPDFRQ